MCRLSFSQAVKNMKTHVQTGIEDGCRTSASCASTTISGYFSVLHSGPIQPSCHRSCIPCVRQRATWCLGGNLDMWPSHIRHQLRPVSVVLESDARPLARPCLHRLVSSPERATWSAVAAAVGAAAVAAAGAAASTGAWGESLAATGRHIAGVSLPASVMSLRQGQHHVPVRGVRQTRSTLCVARCWQDVVYARQHRADQS